MISSDRQTSLAEPVGRAQNFAAADVDQSISQRFADQVALHGDRLAIETDDLTWTYKELDQISGRTAAKILRCVSGDSAGLETGTAAPVALLYDHDALLIAAILAAVKAGRPYVALDPSALPAHRQAVYDTSGATLLIVGRSQRDEGGRLTRRHGHLILEDESSAPALERVSVSPDAPAEIAFTSGTTGQPRGVARSHRALLHHCFNYTNSAQLGPDDRLSLVTPFSLGASMSSLWGALLNGATLLPFDLQAHGISALPVWIRRRKPTLLHCVPSVFRSLASILREQADDQVMRTLRILRLGGESVHAADFELFKRHAPPSCSLLITFSSTETCTVCSMRLDHKSQVVGPGLPSGRPVTGMEVRLLDEAGCPVPPGTIGRINVKSRYLSLGYWRDPSLTASRFKIDPDDPTCRTFQTGDLGRLNGDGLLEHCGRADAQLKIRGLRVDPSDVESALLSYPGVREAAVVGREDSFGQLRLIAYVACHADTYPDDAALRVKMRESLPEHMVPSRFVRLDHLPHGTGGKINRSALPAPLAPSVSRGTVSLAPEHASLPAQIAAVWEEALGIGTIDWRKDFFAELGADSLQTASVIARLENALGRRLPIAALLQNPTVELLARHVRTEVCMPGHTPLALVQRGAESQPPLFFLHGDIYGAGIYCQELARRLGADQRFYSLAPLGFDSWPPPTTITGMAARFVREIRAVQPRGPYLLGGFCTGGVVAFEVARQLQADGQGIDMLALVRASAMSVRWPGVRRLIEGAGDFFSAGEDRQLDFFAGVHDRLKRWRRASQSGLQERARCAIDLLRTVPFPRPAPVFRREPEMDRMDFTQLPSRNRFRAVWALHRRAMLRYKPAPYAGRILLFWPENDDILLSNDRSAGWRKFASQVISHRIPGTHTTCVTQHTDVLAMLMRRYLQSTRDST